ncbi:aminomethyl-transferring glycine dehydrogenase subunit GcvPA [Exiguobacterium antarcticum]|uniref:Probable glycine dehydrogenase (decarboxylating) subunit 1 n=1 Tax=Exiguobacterium antarcticum TaxID=132920 RepID=A0ABT6R1E5_9BACL|nr:aminomethyl-transferring glycine dehydrogenase subunit GcvPA [Exiguobacterium antarcticum]MDI3234131.1 aminomethyl-transferring glycine dehydrogenase subunit GcvPA [Exiguobacterium antarcticum]
MDFRYLPMTQEDEQEMLQTIGADSIEDLLADIPASVRDKGTLEAVGIPLPETDLIRTLSKLADQNMNTKQYPSFLGAGIYDHYAPAVVNHMLLRSEFYTAYTPYQPEISQGELQAIFEYQTMICELTGMDVANSSMYDGITALAEAAMLACAHKKKKTIVLSDGVHPEAHDVVRTYANGPGLQVATLPLDRGETAIDQLDELDDVACVIVQYPNFYGRVEDLQALADATHAKGGLFIVSANPLALGLLEAPGKLGADITIGDCQPFGIPQSFGGPTCGYFTTTKALMRKIPGRLVGQTVDEDGKRGFVLTLQAREQHIRRDKATSNICSNQALNALAASIAMSALGKKGIRELATRNLQTAYALKKSLMEAGFRIIDDGPSFNEFVVELPIDATEASKQLLKSGIIGGLPLGTFDEKRSNHMLVCATELRTKEELDQFVTALGGLTHA